MTVRDVIERHGHFASEGDSDYAAEAWTEVGFEAHEVEEWLKARCFDPACARDLADAGLTPEDASERTNAGAAAYWDTLGFKVCMSDLEVDEARQIAFVT